MVVGPEESVNMELAGWADNLAARLKKLIGLESPFDNRVFRIVVRQSADEDTGIASGTQQCDENGRLVQRLVISGYANAVKEDVEEVFCRLLLNGFVVAKRMHETPENRVKATVPRWLSDGVVQNLTPSAKAQNSRIVVAMWKKGELPSLSKFLNADAQAADAPVDRPLSGVFVAWLLSMPGRGELLDRIFARIAEGEAVSQEWVATLVPGCESVSDLDEKWENWLLRQRHIIYTPGTAAADSISELKSQLLFYRGDFGIPFSTSQSERISLHGLIEERNAGWIPGLVESKCASLRFLAIGKGDEFKDVVEAYCSFLTAVSGKKNPKQLEKLLKTANDKIDSLQTKVEGPK